MIRKIPQKVRDWLRLLFFLGCLLVYIRINLHEYTIYYYTHSAKTDKSQTPAIVIRYLDTVAGPKREQDGKFTYDVRGINTIEYTLSKDSYNAFYDGSTDNLGLSFVRTNNKEFVYRYFYYLDERMKIKYFYMYSEKGEEKKTEVTASDQKIVDQGIQTLIQPILKERVHPPIFFNLQWLYDWLYQEGQ